jgi:hypothetical protein
MVFSQISKKMTFCRGGSVETLHARRFGANHIATSSFPALDRIFAASWWFTRVEGDFPCLPPSLSLILAHDCRSTAEKIGMSPARVEFCVKLTISQCAIQERPASTPRCIGLAAESKSDSSRFLQISGLAGISPKSPQ